MNLPLRNYQKSSRWLLQNCTFLDADSDRRRYTILNEMEDIVDDHMIDTMAVVSDLVIEDGPISQRFQELKRCHPHQNPI